MTTLKRKSKGATAYGCLERMCAFPISRILNEAHKIEKLPLEKQKWGAYSSLWTVLGEEKAKNFMKDYVGNMRNLKDWLPDLTSKEYWRHYEYICVLQAYMTAALVTVGDIEK